MIVNHELTREQGRQRRREFGEKVGKSFSENLQIIIFYILWIFSSNFKTLIISFQLQFSQQDAESGRKGGLQKVFYRKRLKTVKSRGRKTLVYLLGDVDGEKNNRLW